mmetsp:Transcript_8108/g.21449  ORF Transcript_8108/g.21449 Transcript_8108/m.21449 type:complete len:213 (+) Transcript_8108:1733-2371(+)
MATEVAQLSATRGADHEEEELEVVDESDWRVVRRLARRAEIHRTGLWHRAVYLLVFDAHGALLLQRRAPGKSIAPGAWDLSCAEHVSPRESFRDAAVRGAREELGLSIHPSDVVETHGPTAQSLEYRSRTGSPLFDREFVACFAIVAPAHSLATLSIDPVEVAGTRWIEPNALFAELHNSQSAFSPWFCALLDRQPLQHAFFAAMKAHSLPI